VIVMVLEGKTMDTLVNIIYSFKCPYFDPQVLNGMTEMSGIMDCFKKIK
jgi:hypothetical protein